MNGTQYWKEEEPNCLVGQNKKSLDCNREGREIIVYSGSCVLTLQRACKCNIRFGNVVVLTGKMNYMADCAQNV